MNERIARIRRIKEGLRELLGHSPSWGLAHDVEFFLDRLALHPRAFVGVAAGDSWFDYAFTATFLDAAGHDLIDHLDHSGLVNVFRLSTAQETFDNLVYGRAMDDTCEAVRVIEPDFLMFSGGLNDLVGPDGVRLDALLTPAGLDRDAAEAAVSGPVRRAVQSMIDRVRAASPELPVFLHGYAYVVPDGRCVLHPRRGHPVAGPWLKPAFDRRGVPASLRRDAVVALVDLLQQTVDDVAAENPGVYAVDLRNALAPTPADWANELHPTSAGFKKAADVFESVLLPALRSPARQPVAAGVN